MLPTQFAKRDAGRGADVSLGRRGYLGFEAGQWPTNSRLRGSQLNEFSPGVQILFYTQPYVRYLETAAALDEHHPAAFAAHETPRH